MKTRLTAGPAAAGVALGLAAAAVAAVATAGPASAMRPDGPGLASVSAPYVPGVWHVPADVMLLLAPDGPRYAGPRGSLFNGPVDRVERRVDAWWEERLAAGLTPEQADRQLARLGR